MMMMIHLSRFSRDQFNELNIKHLLFVSLLLFEQLPDDVDRLRRFNFLIKTSISKQTKVKSKQQTS